MKQINVLIVEDSIYSADLNVRQLRKAGYTVQYQVVSSGRAMQEALKDKHWDIILSDNSMPGFDALRAIEIRNHKACEVPFIIVSEYISEKDIDRAIREGCSAYIAKENIDTLGQQVKAVLEA
jgi:CheY-like chemotaxis protein